MNTDIDTPDLYQSLQFIYANIYVDCVSKNPLYRFSPGINKLLLTFDRLNLII